MFQQVVQIRKEKQKSNNNQYVKIKYICKPVNGKLTIYTYQKYSINLSSYFRENHSAIFVSSAEHFVCSPEHYEHLSKRYEHLPERCEHLSEYYERISEQSKSMFFASEKCPNPFFEYSVYFCLFAPKS